MRRTKRFVRGFLLAMVLSLGGCVLFALALFLATKVGFAYGPLASIVTLLTSVCLVYGVIHSLGPE